MSMKMNIGVRRVVSVENFAHYTLLISPTDESLFSHILLLFQHAYISLFFD
jgi:hypothetical protein